MADRRMFAKSVVESARFLKMPVSSQALYFHLGMNADDDGVVEAYSIIKLSGSNEDDLKVLYGKGFVRVLNEDLVTYISDWRIQNNIRPDRKKDSVYKNLLLQMVPDAELLEKRERSDLAKKSGPSTDGEMSAQCSVGKYSVGKGSIGKGSVVETGQTQIKYTLDDEVLTEAEYQSLVSQYPACAVDGVISRILNKPYHGCLNVKKIAEWAKEQSRAVVNVKVNSESVHSGQLEVLAKERVGEQSGKS